MTVVAANLITQQWDAAATNYALAANRLDSWVASRLATGSDKDQQAGKQLPQLVKLTGELEKTAREAGTQKPRPVNALFFPQADYLEKLRLTQMPLLLFTYHDADKWYLKDVTNPENVFTDRVDYDAKDGDVPPERLFKKLDDSDHFPKGYVHYKLPDEYDAKGALLRAGRTGVVQTTSPTSPAQWFGYVSAALGAAALVLATGGVGAVWVTACVVGASATGVVSAGLDIYEKQQQGRLDKTTVLVDVVQIVANLAGGAGAVAREVVLAREAVMAAAAGGSAELSPAAVWLARNWGGLARLYKPIQIAGAAADTISFLAYTAQAASELEGIVRGSEADRLRAGALLLARFAATGALTVLTLRSLHELPPKSRIELGFGRDGRPILRVPEGTYTAGQYREGLEKALQQAGHELGDVEVKVLGPKEFDAIHTEGDALVTVSGGKVMVQVRNGALLGAVEEEAKHVLQARNPALRPLFEALDQTLMANWPKLTPAQKVRAVRAKLELELDAQHAVIAEIKAKQYVSDLDQVRADQAREHIENLRAQYAELSAIEADYVARGDTGGSRLFDEPPALFSRRTATRRPYDRRWASLSLKQFKQQYRARYPDSSLTDQELEDYFLIEGKRLNPATGRLKTPDADEDVTPGYEARYQNFEGQEKLILSTEKTPGAGTEKVTFDEDLAKRRQGALDRRDKWIQERDDFLSGKKKPPTGETTESAAAKAGAKVNDASRELRRGVDRGVHGPALLRVQARLPAQGGALPVGRLRRDLGGDHPELPRQVRGAAGGHRGQGRRRDPGEPQAERIDHPGPAGKSGLLRRHRQEYAGQRRYGGLRRGAAPPAGWDEGHALHSGEGHGLDRGREERLERRHRPRVRPVAPALTQRGTRRRQLGQRMARPSLSAPHSGHGSRGASRYSVAVISTGASLRASSRQPGHTETPSAMGVRQYGQHTTGPPATGAATSDAGR